MKNIWHLVCMNESIILTRIHMPKEDRIEDCCFFFIIQRCVFDSVRKDIIFACQIDFNRAVFQGRYFRLKNRFWSNREEKLWLLSISSLLRISSSFFLCEEEKRKTYVWLFSSMTSASFRSTRKKSVILLCRITSSLSRAQSLFVQELKRRWWIILDASRVDWLWSIGTPLRFFCMYWNLSRLFPIKAADNQWISYCWWSNASKMNWKRICEWRIDLWIVDFTNSDEFTGKSDVGSNFIRNTSGNLFLWNHVLLLE